MKIILIMMSLLLFISCASMNKNNTDTDTHRVPASAAVDNIDYDDAEDLALKLNQISNLNELKVKIAPLIRYFIIFSAHTEKIVASFDLKLNEANIQSQAGQDLESIKSELLEMDCQLMELHSLMHEIQEKTEVIYASILERKSPELNDWFYERLAVAENFDTIPQILARYNLVRIVKNFHQQYCTNHACPQADFSNSRFRFPFNYNVDAQALSYKKAHIKDIALFYANPMSTVHSCLARMPNADVNIAKNYFGLAMPVGKFAVTYDDGPHPTRSMAILQAWQQSGFVLPTYFWLGLYAAKSPQVVKAVSAAGAEIGCHSYSHPDLGNIVRASSYDQLDSTNIKFFFKGHKPDPKTFENWRSQTINTEFYTAIDTIEGILKSAPVSPQTTLTKFRFPYGDGYNNNYLLGLLKTKNMIHIHWTIDSLDWQDPNPLSVLERVKAQMALHKRGIILFHDTHAQSVEATHLLIKYFQTQKDFKPDVLAKAIQ